MKWFIFLSIATFANSSALAQEGGAWCWAATEYDTLLSIVSPNGKYRIVVDDTALDVIDLLNGVRVQPTLGICAPSEIAWAPNDSVFLVNQSDGGAVGAWSLEVYRIVGNRLVDLHLSRNPLNEFKKKMKAWCPDEFPNIVGAGWVDGGARLLVVGVVPDHSSCKGMGNIYCYMVDVHSGKIVDSFDGQTLKSRWFHIIGTAFENWSLPDDH